MLAASLLHLFVAIAPGGMPFLNAARIDLRVLIFTLAIGLLSALGFGMIGALSQAPANALTSRIGMGMRRAQLRQVLVATQIAASLVLLAGGALLTRSFWNLQRQNLGMNDENVLTATISLGQAAYPTAQRQMAFYEQLQRNLRWGPGVNVVAISDSLPPGGYHHDQIYASLRVEGQPRFTSGTGGNVAWRWVTPEYFRALTIPLIEGRGFTSDELASANRFVVMSRSLAKRMFHGQDPLGRQVHLASGAPTDQDPPYTVVGVAEDVKNGGLTAGEEPEYYRLRGNRAEDWDRRAVVIVKSSLPAATMDHWIREQVASQRVPNRIWKTCIVRLPIIEDNVLYSQRSQCRKFTSTVQYGNWLFISERYYRVHFGRAACWEVTCEHCYEQQENDRRGQACRVCVVESVEHVRDQATSG